MDVRCLLSKPQRRFFFSCCLPSLAPAISDTLLKDCQIKILELLGKFKGLDDWMGLMISSRVSCAAGPDVNEVARVIVMIGNCRIYQQAQADKRDETAERWSLY